MTRFRTELPPIDFPFSITYEDRLLCLGSCFAEHIGGRLERYKFRSLLNPFGILYNPISIADALERLVSGVPFGAEELFESGGLWHSFAHHGRFSGPDRDEALRLINEQLARAHHFLPTADRLILTFGTAFVFEYRPTGRVVANCHKVPGRLFARRRLSVSEVTDHLSPILSDLAARNPSLRIIATVSPVRHLRDGLVENQRGKAVLLLALDALERQLPFLHYFPAYELLLDDLRDYRFYADDLLHPNDQAIDYIWAYWVETLLDESSRGLLSQVSPLIRAAEHRPLHPGTAAHRTFVQQQLEKIVVIEQKFAFLNFEREKNLFLKQDQ